jgi:hypothetical protein
LSCLARQNQLLCINPAPVTRGSRCKDFFPSVSCSFKLLATVPGNPQSLPSNVCYWNGQSVTQLYNMPIAILFYKVDHVSMTQELLTGYAFTSNTAKTFINSNINSSCCTPCGIGPGYVDFESKRSEHACNRNQLQRSVSRTACSSYTPAPCAFRCTRSVCPFESLPSCTARKCLLAAYGSRLRGVKCFHPLQHHRPVKID